MKNTVGVKFKKEGKIYTFHAADLPLKRGDLVVVITDNGQAIGTVATDTNAVPDEPSRGHLVLVACRPKKLSGRAWIVDQQVLEATGAQQFHGIHEVRPQRARQPTRIPREITVRNVGRKERSRLPSHLLVDALQALD